MKELMVKDAFKEDAGRGVIRIDPVLMAQLNIKVADVLEITHPKTNKKTAALLYPGKPEDEGVDIIRLDGSLRRNLDASLDDIVEIRKIEAVLADKIIFAGLKDPVNLRNPQGLARKLENRIITKDDLISFYAYARRVDLVVVDFYPKADAVRIHLDTKVVFSEKSHMELIDLDRHRVTYEDIGGLDDEIQKIREMIEMSIKRSDLFMKIGINPPSGILLYGPPGTGKTLLARAVSHEIDAHFIMINGPEIMSKFFGESEENLRKIFDEAKDISPSIIVIDNLDSLAPRRVEKSGEVERRVVAQLLSLLDDIKGRDGIFVIGITNRINDIDPALRSAGRFDLEIEINLPDTRARYDILKIHTRGMHLHEDVDLKLIAEKTQGFTGADLETLVKNAGLLVIRENLDYSESVSSETLKNIQIRMEHFLAAVANKPHRIFCPKCEVEYFKREGTFYCEKCGEKLTDKAN